MDNLPPVETRNQLLQAVLEAPLHSLSCSLPDFSEPNFALQGYFDTRQLGAISQKYIVTLATERELDNEPSISGDTDQGDSIPDAWIYDLDQGYCFLIEANARAGLPRNASVVT